MTYTLKRMWKCEKCGYESEEWYDFVDPETREAICPECEEYLD